MTTVGHTLMGLSVGVLCLPGGLSRTARALTLAAFAAIASAPDFPLPCWGHGPYYPVSHSLLANTALAGAMLAVFAVRPGWRRATGGWPVAVGLAAALMSHLLLDSFYNHGLGVQVGWPFGQFALNLPIPFFRSLGGYGLNNPTAISIVLIELAFYGPILLLCIAGRKAWRARAARGVVSATARGAMRETPGGED